MIGTDSPYAPGHPLGLTIPDQPVQPILRAKPERSLGQIVGLFIGAVLVGLPIVLLTWLLLLGAPGLTIWAWLH